MKEDLNLDEVFEKVGQFFNSLSTGEKLLLGIAAVVAIGASISDSLEEK